MDEDGEEKPTDPYAAYRLPGDMLTAHLLALMKGWTGYGYELAKRLEESGLRGYNTGSLYRTLRQMEKHGLISSLWDTSESGPAKRMYTLTSGGTLFLRNWLKLVDMHKSMLEQFLDVEDMRRRPAKGKTPPATKSRQEKTMPARRAGAEGGTPGAGARPANASSNSNQHSSNQRSSSQRPSKRQTTSRGKTPGRSGRDKPGSRN